MSDQTGATATPENITFEDGYAELKRITERLAADDVSVHEMFDGFRRGKGLEKSLRGYLTEREGELTEIEEGRNLPEFNIVAPAAAGEPEEAAPADTGDFEAPSDGSRFTPQSSGGSDDDIPF
jgi:exodeoxyribonuclease VII small subunit